MNWFKLRKRPTLLETEIQHVSEQMSRISDKTSDQYKALAESLERLISISNKRNSEKSVERLSPNTVAVVVGGIVEMLIIMTYEQTHVIATKAFGRILRGRV